MIEEIIAAIRPLNSEAMAVCQERLDNLTKPLNSLKGFEQLAVQLAGISGDSRPREFKAGLILMAGDEGVELNESYLGVKKLVTEFLLGACPIQVMAEHIKADIILLDIGAAADLSSLPIHHAKIAYGTKNFRQGAAMSRDEAKRAVTAGIKIAKQAARQGYSVLGIGGLRAEDSLASLAVVAAYSKKPLANLVNKDEQRIVKAVLTVNILDSADPWDVLSKVGSFEIASLVGVILGAAAAKQAVVLDGLLAAAAAIIAAQVAPLSKAYLIGSHKLPGHAHEEALRILAVPAYLELALTMGQGLGAALGISLLRAALYMLNDMKTFTEAKVAVAEDGPGALKQQT
jgi:nicotinate-nucleotide--dimethylbenzimidazole phosphoribosyltransferase